VHAYLVPGSDGWTVVDTGLGLPDARERWARVLAKAGDPVARIFVTHFHPDHVGAAADLAELTGAPVYEGVLDFEQCERTWSAPERQEVTSAWLRVNGTPPETERDMHDLGRTYQQWTRYARDPILVEPGDRIDGWELVPAPGHADGQLMLLKDGILIAGDHLLGRISPAIGLWPDSSPDPLGDYLTSLAGLDAWAPRIAFPGHGDVLDDPLGRAAELIAHHHDRLAELSEAVDDEPRTAYELSFTLFGRDLTPAGRRFATTETASHLERLVRQDQAVRDVGEIITYRAA